MFTFKAAGSFGALAALLLGSTAMAAQEAGASAAPAASRTRSGFVWDAKKVEHLMNRAGFGARPSDIEAGVALGHSALVEKLVGERVEVEPFFFERIEAPDPKVVKAMSVEDRTARMREIREKDRRQLLDYTTWWYDRMTSGEDPLRERMVLFWHGFFTSSFEEVKRSWLLIQQNQLVRRQALGSYAELLAAMAKDPAMLTFLDNQVNKKASPNENFARELMELFSLGAGNYTEQDVKEAARSLTGRGVSREGNYEFHKRLHDDGEKTVLGVTERMNGDDLVKVILAQDACPRWIAGKLLVHFEGVQPSPQRLADYAAFLRANEYQVQPFLRRLFLDPEFFRDEVVGARVQSPVDFMVGFTRRLGVQVPSAVLGSGATLLGQRLFWPPSVKGWDEGESWISTATIMQRGNLAGFMLGLVKVEDVLSEPETREPPPPSDPYEPGMTDGSMEGGKSGEPMDGEKSGEPMKGGKSDEPMTERPPMKKGGKPGAKMDKRIGVDGAALYGLRRAEASGWTISINLSSRIQKSGARTDAEIADRMLDDLLAIEAPQDTRVLVQTFLARERGRLKLADGNLLDAGAEAERVLRRLAHLIYSLPERSSDERGEQIRSTSAEDRAAFDRRQILTGGVAAFGGMALGVHGGWPGLRLFGPFSAAQGDTTPKTLVLLQLSGGNDGLSMVVPHGDDAYYRNRSSIGIDKKSVLAIDRYRGLHPALRRLKAIYEDGRVAIVEGCGYPNPVRSHFASMDIWHAASERGRYVGEGWLARLSKTAWPTETSTELVVHIGSNAPYSVYSPTRPGISFGSPEVYKWFAIKQSDLEAYRRAGRSGEMEKEPEGGKTGGAKVLDRLRGVLSEAQESSQRVRQAAMSYVPKVTYPNNLVGNSLRAAAALIDARMGTRVLSVELGGFDSHNNQRNQHDARMRELDEALGVFLQDIHGSPAGKNVIVVAFSEFGRRVHENASGGTDHGVAGPMLIAGSSVKGGVYGKHPSLTDLDDGDLKHTTDFRSVYGTVIEKWFGADQAMVLDKRYAPLAFL